MRIYFLWCESRAAGLRQLRVGDPPGQRYLSCRRFASDPGCSIEETAALAEHDRRQSMIVKAFSPVPEGIGPLRPWLMICLLVGLVGSIWSCSKEITMTEGLMRVDRGDVNSQATGSIWSRLLPLLVIYGSILTDSL